MKNVKAQPQDRDQSGVRQLLFKFLPYWPLFLVFFTLSFTLLFLYLKTSVPLYETTSSVLIKDEKKGEEDSKMEEMLNVFGSKKIVENELEIFRSNTVLEDVARRLKLYAPVFEEARWKYAPPIPAYLSCPIVIEAANPDSIRPEKKIRFGFSNDGNAVIIRKKTYPLGQWVESPWGTLKFARNPLYTSQPLPEFGTPRYFFDLLTLDNAAGSIGGNLMVSQSNKMSSIIDLKVKDPIPRRGEEILNAIVVSYNDAAAEKKNAVAVKTLQFIEARLKQVGQELDSIENKIQSYRDKSGVVDISEQSKLYLQRMEDNDKQRNNLNLQLAALNEVEKYVTTKSNEGSIVPSTFNISDPTLNKLVEKLSANESQYEKLKRTTAEENPILKSLREEINKTKPSILENIHNQKKNIESARSLMDQTTDKYSSMLNSVPKKERQLVEVSRQENIKNTIYEFLLKKREESAYTTNADIPDCYIVSSPKTSGAPVSPKKPVLALIALIIPLFSGVIIITLKDNFNNKILFRTEIEKLVGFPIIGEVIQEKQKGIILAENGERSFIVEQFRHIRNAIKHQALPLKGKCMRLIVTSSIKGEGKSFVSVNLALSFARSGKKVALLEMDLHQPQLRAMLDMPDSRGITDYLCGNSNEFDIIQPTKVNNNLFLIPSGYPVQDPSDLLMNGELEHLLDYLDSVFDVVIIDTAPVKIIADAFTVAQYCNLVLYVVRHNHTLRSSLELLSENMEAHNIKNVSFIFNGIKKRGVGKNGYGYGYGYGYDTKSFYDKYHK